MKARSGFTLIELLVVIAIIAILAAILFPVFAQVREKARQTSCASNMKQLNMALVMYVQDADETYPIGNSLWNMTGGWPGAGGSMNWAAEIAPYLKSVGVFACPDDAGAGVIDPAGYRGISESYVANGLTWVWTSTGNNCAGLMCVANEGPPVRVAAVNEPASVISFAEAHYQDLASAGNNYTGWFNNLVTGIPYYINLAPPNQCGVSGGTLANCATAYPNGLYGAVKPDHAGGKMANFAFADGHVKAMNPLATVPKSYVGSDWWNDGEYDNGSDGKASMWFAAHN